MIELRLRHAHECELELQTAVEAGADLGLGRAESLDEAQELVRADLIGLRVELLEVLVVEADVLAERAQHRGVVGDLLDMLQQEELPQVAEEVADELAVVGALFGAALHEEQRACRVALDDVVDDLEEQLDRDDAEYLEHIARGDVVVAEGGELVERTDRVTEAALGVTRDLKERGLVDRDPLALGDARQNGDDLRRERPVEVEALAARNDRLGDLVRFGRGEYEHDVGRRLLECLEERVEGLLGEHVDLIDDVDLGAPLDGSEGDPVAQLTDVVDAAVGGGVHLDHVERRRRGDGKAAEALAAGRRCGRRVLLAVERLGEDLRHARLTDAAWPSEDVGVRDRTGVDGVLEGARHVVLADDIVEGLWPVLAIERELHGVTSLPAARVAVKVR